MQFQLMQISDRAATIFRWPSINAYKISISAQTHRTGNLINFFIFDKPNGNELMKREIAHKAEREIMIK